MVFKYFSNKRFSGFYTTVINTVALISGVGYAIQMVIARAEGEWRIYLRRIIGMIIFINALLLPTTTMTIKDNVTDDRYEVANLPFAFALPIGLIEHFTHILSMGFDQVFSQPGGASSNSYYNYGSVFGARLKKEILQDKIRDPQFLNNMSHFIERCVILPASIGKQFTKEELVSVNDIWRLVRDRAGTFTTLPFSVERKQEDKLDIPYPTCQQAASYLEDNYFKKEIKENIDLLNRKFPGTCKRNRLKTEIAALFAQPKTSVDSIIKHNMMINAINSYRSGNYAAAKAALHHEAGGLISGDLAEKTLTGSLAIMKVIIYGSYIFLFPVLIISGGIS